MRTLKLETEMCEEPDLIRGLRPRLQPLAEAARLHLTHSSALDLPLETFATATVRPENSHYSGLSPGTRLLSNPVLFLTLSYSGLYPESYSLIQKILNFHLIFSIVLCVFYRIRSFPWERWPFLSFTTKTTPLKKKILLVSYTPGLYH